MMAIIMTIMFHFLYEVIILACMTMTKNSWKKEAYIRSHQA